MMHKTQCLLYLPFSMASQGYQFLLAAALEHTPLPVYTYQWMPISAKKNQQKKINVSFK